MRQFDENVTSRPSGLQCGLPKIVSSPWRTSSRVAPLAQVLSISRSGPSRFDRKASVFPSGETSAWYSVAAFVRRRRRFRPSARPPRAASLPVRSDVKTIERPSGVQRARLSSAGLVGEPALGAAARRDHVQVHRCRPRRARRRAPSGCAGLPERPPARRRRHAVADAAGRPPASSPRDGHAARTPRARAAGPAGRDLPLIGPQSSAATGWPSVPLARATRVDLMKSSRSPSSTRSRLPVSCFVRWSFTIR